MNHSDVTASAYPGHPPMTRRLILRLAIVLLSLLWAVPSHAIGLIQQKKPVAQPTSHFSDPNANIIGRMRVAVLPFSVPAQAPDLQLYGAGLADSLTMGLQNVPQFIMIAGSHIQRSMEAQHLAGKGMLDEDTAVKIGRLLGAQLVISGAIQAAGNSITIAASVADVQTGQIRDLQQLTGPLANLFELQDQLVGLLLQARQLTVTPAQQQRMDKILKATSNLKAYDAYLQGRASYLLGTRQGFQEATQSYQHAIEADPQYALAYTGLAEAWDAWAYLKSQDGEPNQTEYEQAYPAAQKALALNSELAAAHRAFGRAIGNLGKPGREAEAQRALELNANDGESWYELWMAAGTLDPDHAYIRKALELQPDLLAAHIERGVALANINRYDEAVAEYKEALSINPHDARAHNSLGNAWYNLGRFNEAIAEYRETLRTDPMSAVAHANLGEALSAIKQYEEAEGQLREALKLNPVYAMAHYNMGDLLLAQGKKKEAIQEYELYLKYAPSAPDEADLRDRIRTLTWSE